MTVTVRRVLGDAPVRQRSVIVCRWPGTHGKTIVAPMPVGPPAGTSNGGCPGERRRDRATVDSARPSSASDTAVADGTCQPIVICARLGGSGRHQNSLGALNWVTLGAPLEVVMPGLGVSAGGLMVGIGRPGREVGTELELPPQPAQATAMANTARHACRPAGFRTSQNAQSNYLPRWPRAANQPPPFVSPGVIIGMPS